MAKKKTKSSGKSDTEGLLTLSEISERANISMPTLQRYKKLHQDRIPSVGEGRKQRYPEEAIAVFQSLKEENVGRRGRRSSTKAEGKKSKARKPRRAAAKSRRSAGAGATGSDGQELLPLSQISEELGISYPTLSRYVKLHGDEIPSEGTGRRRRYYPEAKEIFQRLREQSSRGGRRKSTAAVKKTVATKGGSDSGLVQRMAGIEKAQARLEKKIDTLLKEMRKPRRII